VRRAFLVLIAGGALALAATVAVAPPAARRLALTPDARAVRGVFHVHTTASDGAGTAEDVAAAAKRAGLDFVVLTDHGDGTRRPAAPRYRDGVLLVEGVEISTTGGHYAAIGLGPAPYRLAGEPRDVVEDVTRLGGFGVAAHPDSVKGELSWREWQAPFEGLEWLNADSAWRDEPPSALALAMAAYWLRGPEVIASLFDRPSTPLARWDALLRRRRVVALGGHDAHARMGPRGDWEPADGGYTLRLPSYEAAFRAFSLGVSLPAPFSRTDAAADAAALLGAIRAGRVVTAIDALAGPARLSFVADHDGHRTEMGGEVPPGIAARLSATLTPAVPGVEVQVVRDGAVVARSREAAITLEHPASAAAAVYRVEVAWPGAPGTPPIPWIVSNAIRVGFAPPRAAIPLLPPARWARPAPQDGWRVEQHPASVTALTSAPLTPTNTAWTLTWQLGPGAPAGQYAAIAVPLPPRFLTGADRIAFTARAAAPMRLSVQLRVPDGPERGRWCRSVYVSTAAAAIAVPLRELTPVDAAPGTPLVRERVDSLLLVVDTVNTAPGTAGDVTITALRVEG
jgi:hypothetical protein